MCKRIVRILICALLCSVLVVSASAEITLPPPSLSAESAVLIDAATGEVLCEKNAHTRMAMASTTKIMTALVAVETGELEKVVSVNADAVGIEGSSIYLYAGEKMTLRDLISAMLLESANDAAAAIAIEVGGSIEGFCALMNERVRELGLSDTHFTNPHGLYDEEHYTTAYELSLIAAAALENDTLREITSTRKMTIEPVEGNVRVLYNHNKLLSMYEGAIGVKTGFTKKSGRCLVGAAERDGLTLITVTLGAPDDWNDHKKLFDLGFEAFETVTLAKNGELCYMLGVMGGTDTRTPVVFASDLSLTLPKGAEDRVICTVETFSRYEFAPLEAGRRVGRAVFLLDGRTLGEVDIVTSSRVERLGEESGLLDKIINFFK